MALYDDYDMAPVTDNGDLPWEPGIETAWAKKAWAAIQEGETTSALCGEVSLQAAFVASLAIFFNDFEILAWGESADCMVSD